MQLRSLATICLLLTALSGCALTTDRISLQHDVPQGVSQIPGASDVSVSVQVNDLRSDKSKVSSKKNGFGMEMAPIVSAEDVTVTFQHAIERELEARGFRLNEDARVQIAADLTRFYNDHKVGLISGDAVADLDMRITVKAKNGKSKYSRRIFAQGIEANTMLMTGENARLALNRALANGMQTLFEDKKFLAALR